MTRTQILNEHITYIVNMLISEGVPDEDWEKFSNLMKIEKKLKTGRDVSKPISEPVAAVAHDLDKKIADNQRVKQAK